ncbi:MAG TPA: hypothetical protein G4O14_02625 [Anaerolineae bacterium]|nr:hypothetical protein [Anaerolineae bacterium]
MSKFITSLKIVLIIIALSACSKPPTTVITVKPTETFGTPSPTTSSTLTPTLVPSSTLTPTIKPYGTQIASTPLDHDASIFIPVEIPLLNETSLTDLSPDLLVIDSVVDRENRIEAIRYLSVFNSNQGNLFTLGDLINPDYFFFDGTDFWVFGGYPVTNTRYAINPPTESVFEFPVCTRGWDEPSPFGQKVSSICTEPGVNQDGVVVVEIISLRDGRRFQLEIPSHDNVRYANNFIHWIDEDSFIGLMGLNEEPCLVSISKLGMLCAPELVEKPLLSVSPLGTYLLTNRSIGATWIKDVHLLDCFTDQSKCDPIVTLDDEKTGTSSLIWSPDETILAVDHGDHLTSTTAEIGFYDTETWTYHYVSTFPRSSGFFEWCPDSSCMIIVGDPSYILYLDGTRQEIPHDLNHPIALIEVP